MTARIGIQSSRYQLTVVFRDRAEVRVFLEALAMTQSDGELVVDLSPQARERLERAARREQLKLEAANG